ncbi:metallopeptidase TldD-related protein [Ideonella sp. A 288]|uniref:metallopeptidase TldD-related protein n=1 Tax=Ideonella sp. A 288 TaxID=1962181 RepID=UPI000B4C143D|nr:metallopeptidase TldD-related protein [Ideonella sp. A 288]
MANDLHTPEAPATDAPATDAPDPRLPAIAERVLGLMRRQGFDAAQVSVSHRHRHEVCVAHNEPSLLRGNESFTLQLVGLLDGRRATTEGSDIGDEALAASVRGLWDGVASAPQDEANAVSSGQRARTVRGPVPDGPADLAALADAMGGLLAWRARETPTMMIEEALAGLSRLQSCTLTSGGTELACDLRWFDAEVFGLARDGGRSSSFNFAGGRCDCLADRPVVQRFGIGEMMQTLTRQVHAQPIGGRFVGSVVLTPRATASLLGWLLGQLADQALIDGSSVYRQRVGQVVASPLLTLRSRFDAPGVRPQSADAFATPPVTLLTDGRLDRLTPSLYGSRKTGLPHVSLAADGWEVAAGATALDALIAGVPRGALVDRLSMGRPAANGDFSGVIKNSAVIDGGRVGTALSETMISGNVAQMLRDVQAVSTERIDTGDWLLPWLRVDGLHFS